MSKMIEKLNKFFEIEKPLIGIKEIKAYDASFCSARIMYDEVMEKHS